MIFNKTTGSPVEDYYDNCYWSSRNVTVEYNQFDMNTSAVRDCSVASLCGYMGIFSLYGPGSRGRRPIALHDGDRDLQAREQRVERQHLQRDVALRHTVTRSHGFLCHMEARPVQPGRRKRVQLPRLRELT